MRAADPRAPYAGVFRGLRAVGVLQSSLLLFATQAVSKSVISRTVINSEMVLALAQNGY
jgi:hypothetical protein